MWLLARVFITDMKLEPAVSYSSETRDVKATRPQWSKIDTLTPRIMSENLSSATGEKEVIQLAQGH